MTDSGLSRRDLLKKAAALAIVVACADEALLPTTTTPARPGASTTTDETSTSSTHDTAPDNTESAEDPTLSPANPLTAAMFTLVPMCGMTRETTSGPFPTAQQLFRSDVTEGYPGHPVRLGLRVVDAACEPVPDVDLEIWHTDASGDYSEYIDDGSGKDEGPGSTFLRGYQTTNADGIVEFQTIYPGFYENRPPHIHLRVRRGQEIAFTGQFYFENEFSEEIYVTGAYEEFGTGFTRNEDDFLAVEGADDNSIAVTMPAETLLGEGSLALLNVNIG